MLSSEEYTKQVTAKKDRKIFIFKQVLIQHELIRTEIFVFGIRIYSQMKLG